MELRPIEPPVEVLEQHPIGRIIQPMTPSELRELTNDIKEHGLRHPVVTVFEGMTIDATSRYIVCMTENIPGLQFQELIGTTEDAIAYVRSENLIRRHLDKGEKTKALELLLLQPERTDRSIAKESGVSQKSVSAFRGTLFSNNTQGIISEDESGNPPEQPAKVVTPRVPRREDSGRAARGVKPGSSRKGKQKLPSARATPLAKPAITEKERDVWVNTVMARVKADPATACTDMMISMSAYDILLQQRLSQSQKENVMKYACQITGARIEILGWM